MLEQFFKTVEVEVRGERKRRPSHHLSKLYCFCNCPYFSKQQYFCPAIWNSPYTEKSEAREKERRKGWGERKGTYVEKPRLFSKGWLPLLAQLKDGNMHINTNGEHNEIATFYCFLTLQAEVLYIQNILVHQVLVRDTQA